MFESKLCSTGEMVNAADSKSASSDSQFKSEVEYWILYPNLVGLVQLVASWSPKPKIRVQVSGPSPHALLAQWTRALGYEPGCRRFKSCRGRHLNLNTMRCNKNNGIHRTT